MLYFLFIIYFFLLKLRLVFYIHNYPVYLNVFSSNYDPLTKRHITAHDLFSNLSQGMQLVIISVALQYELKFVFHVWKWVGGAACSY